MQGPLKMVGLAARVGLALVKKPHLIGTALRQAAALAPRRWWVEGTRLPVPRQDYLHFRTTTLSGEPDAMPRAHDVIVYLEWCKSMRSLPRRA